MPKPPEKENKLLTWPNWPLKLRTSSSHEEGAEREFAVLTKSTSSAKTAGDGRSHCVRVDGKIASRSPAPSSSIEGRSRPARHGLRRARASRACSNKLGVEARRRGNVEADTLHYHTGNDRRSSPAATCAAASRLVVWAIREGRQCARAVDKRADGRNDAAALRRRRPMGWAARRDHPRPLVARGALPRAGTARQRHCPWARSRAGCGVRHRHRDPVRREASR